MSDPCTKEHVSIPVFSRVRMYLDGFRPWYSQYRNGITDLCPNRQILRSKGSNAHIPAKNFTHFCSGRLRRPLRNLLQNRSKNQVPLISPVIPERIFIQIALQVFMRNLMVNATDAAFHQRPETLNRVRVNVSLYINLCAVIDAAMFVAATFAESVVRSKFIGKDCALGHNKLAYCSAEGFSSQIVNGLCNNTAF